MASSLASTRFRRAKPEVGGEPDGEQRKQMQHLVQAIADRLDGIYKVSPPAGDPAGGGARGAAAAVCYRCDASAAGGEALCKCNACGVLCHPSCDAHAERRHVEKRFAVEPNKSPKHICSVSSQMAHPHFCHMSHI